MNKSYTLRCLILLLVFTFTTFFAEAQRKPVNAEDILSVNGSQGTEFWIAIPPNEILPFPISRLEIYVASAYDTEVEVYQPAGNQSYKRKVTANQIRTLNDARGETSWTWEVRENEQVVNKAVRLRASKPISVYVLNSKPTTSDGYLAIPTSVWGNEYIATTYYDFREWKSWAAGFIIIAKENGTILDINLRGVGEAYGRTANGKKINTGEVFQVSMDAGDVYMVKGDGLSRGSFDLTGSLVKSNNPIGMISFHERTTMPNMLIQGNGRDHLCEMTPPVSTWGKKYSTVEYSRTHANGLGFGDVFRVVASQAGTKWNLKYYDHKSKKLIGQGGGILQKAGEFADVFQAQAATALTSGFSVWEADKPIFVMQYSCSASWDGDNTLDPFMINVIPEEQYISNTIFQTPTDPKFTKHFLNLVVWADTADVNYIDNLKSLTIDDKPVWVHPQAAAPLLLFTRMPESNLHWTTLIFAAEATAHRIKSNGKVKFGGYIYGFGAVDSYGWPAASGFRPTTAQDTMPPVLKADSDCGDYEYTATEFRNIPDPPLPVPRDSDQVETGIAMIDTLDGSNSYNYKLTLITDQVYPRDPSYRKFDFRWEVIDRSKDAYAIFFVQDYADNITLDTIFYFADRISFNPDPLRFDKIRLGTKKSLNLTVTNSSTGEVILTQARLMTGAYYKITTGTLPPTVTLLAGQSHQFTIEYDGSRETTDLLTDFDIDTIIVNTTCGEFKLGLSGVAAVPQIVVDNFDAGVNSLNAQKCKPAGIRVYNPGSDTLTVTAIVGFAGTNFTLSAPTIPALPFRVAPGEEVFVKEVCYQRGDVGSDSIDVTFTSDASETLPGSDSISTWIGRTQSPGPAIVGHNWLRRRVNTLHQAFGTITNDGNQSLTLNGCTFSDGSQYFPAGSNDANFVFKVVGLYSKGSPVTSIRLSSDPGDEISVDVLVQFRPAAVQAYVATIVPVWESFPAGDLSALLEGEGIQPTYSATGDILTCLETPEASEARMRLVITNGGNSPLTVSKLAYAAGTGPEFAWDPTATPTVPFVIPATAGGNSITIPVLFTRPVAANGGFNATLEIEHDGIPGNGIDTDVVDVKPETVRFVVGSCTGPEIAVTDIAFNPALANCDRPVLEFTIRNVGGGLRPLEIREILPVGADAGAFTVVNISGPLGTAVTTPFLLGGLETARVQVEFAPALPNAMPWANRNYAAQFRIMNYVEGEAVELTPDTYANVSGAGYVVPVTMNLSNNIQGQAKDPGSVVQFSVAASSNSWNAAGLVQYTADVIYQTETHAYKPGSVVSSIAGRTVSEPTITRIDGTTSAMRFTSIGVPVLNDGIQFTFETTLLLSTEIKATQSLVVDLTRPCLVPTTTGSETEILSCALKARVVEVGSVNFAFSPVSPNPVQGGLGILDFAVGINAPTYIDVINSTGQVVRTFVNETLAVGAYTLEFQTAGLPNGTYTIRIKCADYAATQQVVVAE